jgi:hypothetical protein
MWGDSRRSVRVTLQFAIAAILLGAIAWASPVPDRVTDRLVYEATASRGIVPDCSDLQCFRVLVPWVLGRLPGPSPLRWKAYAVVANAAAGAGVWALCLTFGVGRRTAWMAAALSAFGFGSLYTLHDPYTSDPLMYALGPIITNELFSGRTAVAAALGIIGVLAKEFAAAPLYVFAAYQASMRRWARALEALVGANFAFIAWALLTMTLMIRFNYAYGWNGNGSADLAGGSALALWLGRQSLRGVVFAMFNEFGALYVLAPVGFLYAPRALRRLVLAALPVAAIFGYVQQPDRGLWNFHFLATALGAVALQAVPAALAWATIVLFALGNLRVGAQLPIAGLAHVAIGASIACALVTAVAALAIGDRRAVPVDGMPAVGVGLE